MDPQQNGHLVKIWVMYNEYKERLSNEMKNKNRQEPSYKNYPDLSTPHNTVFWIIVSILFGVFALVTLFFLIKHCIRPLWLSTFDRVFPRVFRAWYRLHARLPFLVPAVPRSCFRLMAREMNEPRRRGRGVNRRNEEVEMENHPW